MRRTFNYSLISLVLVAVLMFGGCIPKPKKVEVPNLIGMEAETAIESLESMSLNPDALKGDAAPEEDLENIVYFQAPDAGERVRKGSIVTFTSYDEYIFVRPQRKISILWVGTEDWIEDKGGTHIMGFHPNCWPWWYEAHPKVKLIMYFKYKTIAEIEEYVRVYKNHPNNGGYWCIEHHESDITGTQGGMTIEESKRRRREQYQAIRAIDPDYINHPVVGVYNMTSASDNGWPGWSGAFPTKEEGKDCDIFFCDCYANKSDGTVDYAGMQKGLELVRIGLERTEGLDVQFIPCIGANYHPDHMPSSLVDQFEWWKEQLPEISAVAIWNSGRGNLYIGVDEDEYLAEEAREINRRLGLLE